MLGAILGDYLGSPFEGGVLLGSCQGAGWSNPDMQFTDDTVMTVACAEVALQQHKSHSLADYGKSFNKWGRKYPGVGYGSQFNNWLQKPYEEIPPELGSFGNGSAMRASPIAWVPGLERTPEEEAKVSALCTHAHPEGIRGAVAVVEATRLALRGASVERMRVHLEELTRYNLRRTVYGIRSSGYTFNSTCQGSVPEALVCALEARSFEHALHLALSLGGDTDTQACIAGAVAEARFHNPLKNTQIPLWEIDKYRKVLTRLPQEMLQVVRQFVRVAHRREPSF